MLTPLTRKMSWKIGCAMSKSTISTFELFWHDLLKQHVPDKNQLPTIFSRRIKQDSLLRAQQELLSHDNGIVPGHPVHGGHAG